MTTELARITVPELKPTLQRYLEGLRTVVSPGQLDKTRRLVEDFQEDHGQRLQRRLREFAERHDNWVTPLWLDDMYLKNSLPLPINSSPCMMLPKMHFRSITDQLRFAAKTIIFFLKYKQKLDRRELEQDLATGQSRGKPMCMETYYRFFNAYRRPGFDKDSQFFFHDRDAKNDHIIVAFRNQFFVLQIERDAPIPSEDFIYDQLRLITQQPRDQPPIGVLTTQDRRTWAEHYHCLQQNPTNNASLQMLEQCLFVLCLDEATPNLPNYTTIRRESITLDLSTITAHMLHGSDCEHNSANRWYDKFLQFIVGRDGVCGVICEHSISEGITVIKFCEELLDFLQEKPPSNEQNSTTFSQQPRHLIWQLNDQLTEAIQAAIKHINKLADNLDLYVLRFRDYGKGFIKSMKISPDAYIQLALQLTHYKVHRKLVSTYESASLRHFHLGRVDNIRANSFETLNWVRTMCDEVQASDEEKVDLFDAAVAKQKEIMAYTLSGNGPDNHLMALLEMARVDKEPGPELFQNDSYQEYLHFRLSTSQVPSSQGVITGYGPVVPDGYGCCYNPCEDVIDFCISSFFSDESTSSDFFALSLEGSLLQMRELCLKKEQLCKPS